MPSKLPWDQVKAESLRSICVDLGRRLSTKADMISFLRTVEDEGLDAALGSDAFQPKPTKRKVDQSAKHEPEMAGENDAGHRAKRARRSTGGLAAPEKLSHDERPHRRFDGVVLTSHRRLSRSTSQPADGDPHSGDNEEGRAPDVASASVGLAEGVASAFLMNHNREFMSHAPESVEGSQVVPELEPSWATGPSGGNLHADGEDTDGEGDIETTTDNDPNDFSINSEPPEDLEHDV